MRLIVFSRHAHTSLNEEGRVNGDPSVPVALTELGREQAAQLGHQLANVALELVVHTRFGRTLETAKVALGDREVPLLEEPLLDDVDVGELEGWSIGDYREWKRRHSRSDPFPAGESLDDAARRYTRAFRALLARDEKVTLVVCHEIPIRYALNAAGGSGDLDGPEHAIPNATPFLFDAHGLERAADGIEQLLGIQ